MNGIGSLSSSVQSGAELTVEDVEMQLAKLVGEAAGRRRKLIIGLTIALVIAALGVAMIIFTPKDSEDRLVGISLAFYSILGAILWNFWGQRKLQSIEQDVGALQAKKRILERFAPREDRTDGSDTSYFDRLVDINLSNLGAYYGLVKVHASNGFIAATAAGAIGFALVIFGLLMGIFTTDQERASLISYVASGAGIITEFIAGIFFYLYSKTVRQLKEYHDSLLVVQNVMLSFKLVGDTPDPEQKAKMVTVMLGYLVGQHQKPPPDG